MRRHLIAVSMIELDACCLRVEEASPKVMVYCLKKKNRGNFYGDICTIFLCFVDFNVNQSHV